MRCLLLLLAFAFTSSLSAQNKADTTYNRWGELNQIRFSSTLDVTEMNKAERFQRGLMLNASETVWELDSIRLFDRKGGSELLKGSKMNELMAPGNERGLAKRLYGDPLKVAAKKRDRINEISTATDYVEGRAGMRVRRSISQPAKGKSVKDIKRLDESPEIELIDNPEGENGEIIVKVRIPAGATQRKLVLDFGEGGKWEKLYTIRGYHLNETDFKRQNQLTDEQTWRADGRHHLYLRLRSTEKLLYISQGETRYKPVPVGRQLDEIYLKGLATGKYLLEIIDLGSRQKRYHWLVIGD
ncbi:MAG: hypothetical protein OTI34_03535 [Lewinella sp.]|nr:hypothetical protein [Lewinella sp.]